MGLPTYNRPHYVRHAVESLRAQSLRDFRVVVSDNASPGDVGETVRAYIDGLRDPRFTFVRQTENGGEYGQGRYLFAAAGDADYFCILHDDDLLTPHYLQRAVDALDAAPDAALFVANPWLFDHDGAPSAERTRDYLRDHGRRGRRAGPFPILDRHMQNGFTPISGTLFRMQALGRSGFVDADCHGNFPFELNIFTRLGDMGATGWFDPEPLLGFRYHDGQLRNTLDLMRNPHVVGTMLRILQRRRYTGAPERRRRMIVARLYRAQAEMSLAQGDRDAARLAVQCACAANPLSPRAWRMRVRLALTGASA